MKQQSYEKILVPFDGSKLAASVLPEVLAIVSAFNPKVIVAQVVDSLFQINTRLQPLSNYPSGFGTADLAEQMQKSEVKVAMENLKHFKEKLSKYGVAEVEIILKSGNPGDEIVKLAKTQKCDLIIMSTHGRSGLGRVLLGSVADQVIHQASCPVLIIRPKK